MQSINLQQLRQPHPEQSAIDSRAARLLRSSSQWTGGPSARPPIAAAHEKSEDKQASNEHSPAPPPGR